MEEMRIYSETVKRKYHLGNLHVVGRIILKYVGKIALYKVQ
jgi:hypothetical protein